MRMTANFHRRGCAIAALMLAVTVLLSACYENRLDRPEIPPPRVVGNPDHGAQLVSYYGCGGCHTIHAIPDARGQVGPPLDGFASRVYIAGMLRNTPDNLARWIRNPQAVVPGNVMPRMGIDAGDARDIAAFLYTQNN